MDSQRFVRQMWAAWSSGNFDEVETAFAPDARWRAVEDGPWNCESRAQILRVMRENRQRREAPAGTIEEVTDVGGRILVGFRPDSPRPDGWPLENGIRYVVLTVKDGLVTEMKGCASRQAALDHAAG
jgi:ketosteroid isomerase-like protein